MLRLINMVHHILEPDEYTIKKSTIKNAGKGAFTNVYLPKGTTIGNYHGKKLTAAQYDKLPENKTDYLWEISTPKGRMYIDAKLKKYGNWLRYLNDSKDSRINVEPYQYKQKIYYRTTKNIKPGKELFISYGDEYW
jgi:SET domain-containing protein